VVSEPVAGVDRLNRQQRVGHKKVVDQKPCLHSGMSHEHCGYYTDLIAEWEPEKDPLYQVKHSEEYPVGCPMGKLGGVDARHPVVPEVVKRLIDRYDQPADYVNNHEKDQAACLHGPACQGLPETLHH
jgi:hypothetical protein